MRRLNLPARQLGVTLIELMVGIAVGSIVMLGVAFSWSMAIQNNAYMLGVTAMNNDMRSIMQLITADVRRATARGSQHAVTLNNDGTCMVFDAHISSESIGDTSGLSYASEETIEVENEDGDMEEQQVLIAGTLVPSGYRFTNNRLQMWYSDPPVAPSCDNSTNWRDIFVNGDRGVTIETFKITNDGSWCLDLDLPEGTSAPNGSDPGSLYKASEEGICTSNINKVELLMVNIELSGSVVVGSSERTFSFFDSVKVRNDRVLSGTSSDSNPEPSPEPSPEE